MNREALARKLRVLRAERRLTMRDVQRMSGVSKYTLSQAERGEQKPLDSTLAKLAAVYGVPVEDLFEAGEIAGKVGAPAA